MSEPASITTEEGSTNVYADLNYPDAAAMQRKSQLASGIAHTIREQGLTLEAAAAMAGMEPCALSRITRGQFRDIEEFQLLDLMTRLGHDVTISVGPVKRRPGHIELHFT